jgi:hypothetical protein
MGDERPLLRSLRDADYRGLSLRHRVDRLNRLIQFKNAPLGMRAVFLVENEFSFTLRLWAVVPDIHTGLPSTIESYTSFSERHLLDDTRIAELTLGAACDSELLICRALRTCVF